MNPFHIPFFRQNLVICKSICNTFGLFANHIQNGTFQVFPLKRFPALPVYNLPLLVHYIIIFYKLLPNIKVASLNLCLRIFNCPANQVMFNRLTLFHAQFFHNP